MHRKGEKRDREKERERDYVNIKTHINGKRKRWKDMGARAPPKEGVSEDLMDVCDGKRERERVCVKKREWRRKREKERCIQIDRIEDDSLSDNFQSEKNQNFQKNTKKK